MGDEGATDQGHPGAERDRVAPDDDDPVDLRSQRCCEPTASAARMVDRRVLGPGAVGDRGELLARFRYCERGLNLHLLCVHR